MKKKRSKCRKMLSICFSSLLLSACMSAGLIAGSGGQTGAAGQPGLSSSSWQQTVYAGEPGLEDPVSSDPSASSENLSGSAGADESEGGIMESAGRDGSGNENDEPSSSGQEDAAGSSSNPDSSGDSADPESAGDSADPESAEDSYEPESAGDSADPESSGDASGLESSGDSSDPEKTITVPVEVVPQEETGGESAGSADRVLIEPAAEESFGILRAPLLGAAGDGEILAERVEGSSIQVGDRIVIVCDAASNAVGTTPTGTRISPAEVTVAETATRQVLTAIADDAAVFEVESAGDNKIYLKCDQGYLTSAATGNGLYYAASPEDCSAWQIRDGEFLYNPAAAYNNGTTTYRNYYLEYYSYYNNYTTYGKSASGSQDAFRMSFYRMGNSKPDEVITDEDYYILPVFETSDTHGYLADTTGDDILYLLAYISDKVKDVRGYGEDARKDKALLLDGGDIYQGNTMSNLLQGQSLAEAYRIMDYDAVTIGNHEFDWGIETTVDSDRTMMDSQLEGHSGTNEIPVIISNLYHSGVPVSFADNYIILEKTATDENGNEIPVKIGVIGFAEDYSSSVMYSRFTGEDYSINPDFAIANELAAYLEGVENCDATILLTHQEATQGAEGLGEDSVIDLVLGGHTHQSVNGTTSWGLRYMEPSCYGRAYGYSELAFQIDEDGKPVFRKVTNARVIPTNSDQSKLTNDPANADELDPELVKLTDDVMEILSDLYKEEIGYITESAYRYVYLPDSGNRSTTYGNWAASIYARIADADIGFVNRGGLRTDMPLEDGADSRTIVRSDIYTMFPFDNHIQCYELTWEELLEAFDYSLTEQGSTILSQMVGVDCYYTDKTVNALVTADGKAVYANGEWAEGWKDKKIRVAVSEFIGTTDRVDEGGSLHNPFVAWSGTDRLISDEKIDSEGAYEVLTAEAAANNGLLTIDTQAHYINQEFTGALYVSDETEDPADTGNNTGNSTENTTGNSTENTTGNITENTTGNSTENSTGNSTENATGNNTGNNIENNTGNSSGNSTGNSTSNSSGNSTGNSTSNSSGNSTANNTSNSSSNRTGNSTTGTNRTVTGNRTSKAPGTGDENRPWFWVTIAAVSGFFLLILAGIIVCGRYRRQS